MFVYIDMDPWMVSTCVYTANTQAYTQACLPGYIHTWRLMPE